MNKLYVRIVVHVCDYELILFSNRDYITFDMKLSFNVIGLSMCNVYKIRLAIFFASVCHYTRNESP